MSSIDNALSELIREVSGEDMCVVQDYRMCLVTTTRTLESIYTYFSVYKTREITSKESVCKQINYYIDKIEKDISEQKRVFSAITKVLFTLLADAIGTKNEAIHKMRTNIPLLLNNILF
ncbi:hypothetical protein PPL_02999 [Heterostelium album PN500]|uniref:Uncharacterized protein n=1 Tax=Heterostelium pallidum (strain ATCC 26659 / Pp 5 / PN500) TaxID=670386 RepID=D3B3N1_HETP5|nr:hypothetical protein PPL_02999 [Heterostelium album PN500]EFA83929.1 hypothetical protein PPL_02999 [Heterostelium album PN500]|eukprot:XP_020436046.1 hypothetical protein PPL_02999 [Heterostelium album PN500]